MGLLINKVGGKKSFYTKEQDLRLVELSNEGKSKEEIRTTLLAEFKVDHPGESVGYRLRKLSNLSNAHPECTTMEALLTLVY
jgi:hypothetical protein